MVGDDETDIETFSDVERLVGNDTGFIDELKVPHFPYPFWQVSTLQ